MRGLQSQKVLHTYNMGSIFISSIVSDTFSSVILYVHVCMCMYVIMYVCTYVCMYVSVYVYTSDISEGGGD